MSLRLRLIVAFFVLSVVPLGAVTIYTYLNNVKAVRDAAAREADLLTGELTQRMQLVTAQLSERVEHLMDLPQAQVTVVADASTGKSKAPVTKPATPAPVPATSSTTVPAAGNVNVMDDRVAAALGEAAMLLNNVELRGTRTGGGGQRRDESSSGRSGRGQPSQGAASSIGAGAGSGLAAGGGAGAASTTATSGAGTAPATTGQKAPSLGSTGTLTSVPHFAAPPQPRFRSGGRGARPDAATTPAAPATGAAATQGAAPEPPGPPGIPPPGTPPAPTIVDTSDPTHIKIDMAPIWRDVLHQIVPDGKIENLTPEERQRVAREVNQRLLGIKQGLQISAAGLQKQAEDIRKEAQAQANSAKETVRTPSAPAPPAPVTPAPAVTAPATPSVPMKKVSALSGNHLNVQMEKNGQVVQQVNAEINLPNVLATVFSTTRRDRGEVPFAIGKDGHIYTPSDDDRQRVESLGLATPGAPGTSDAPSTSIKGDWIIVTSADPTGSGLRFGIARPVGDSMADLRKTAARNAGFGLGFIAIALVGIVPLSGRLTRNLSTLTEGVERIAHGDYRARVPVKSTDEIGQLATAFNRMAADVETHQRAAVEQERIKRELELGRQIQHEMLPHSAMRFGLLEIQGVSVPAREVGGDFFNYFEVPGGHVAMLVGDVSGKGVGAALLMANIQASLRTRLALGQDLSAIMDAIDHDIEENTPGAVYATLFVGLFDPATRELQYVNAGHHPQYALRAGRGLERMASTGLPVGLIAGRGYRADRVQLQAADMLFFYTDGCVEAESEAGDMFGADRLESVLSAVAATSPDQILLRVEEAIKTFRGTREPFDDETMMAVRVS